jgi:hypothetical protein
MITILVFIALIYQLSGIFDPGKTIDDIKIYKKDQLKLVENLGVGLIEYDSRVDKILDTMLETANVNPIDDKNSMSYNLQLNKDLQIDTIVPYITDIQKSINPLDRGVNRPRLGNIDVTNTNTQFTGYYETRKLAKEINKDWRPQQGSKQSLIQEDDINVMLRTFMPKVLSMANYVTVPRNIHFQGASLVVSRSPLGPQLFHQDIDRSASIGSAVSDHDYRIMVFDRDGRYDTSWTHIATDVDNIKANKFVKMNFNKYDFAKLIDFDIDKSKYIALVFDNNKVFHRTPPTKFWDWVLNYIPEKRRVTQFRISWDDSDQINPIDDA